MSLSAGSFSMGAQTKYGRLGTFQPLMSMPSQFFGGSIGVYTEITQTLELYCVACLSGFKTWFYISSYYL